MRTIHDHLLLLYSFGFGVPSAGLFCTAIGNGPSWVGLGELVISFGGALFALLLFTLWGIGLSPDMDDGWS